jgi:hypothetical protein
VPANEACELVDVADQLAHVGGVQPLEIFVQEGSDVFGLGRKEALFY